MKALPIKTAVILAIVAASAGGVVLLYRSRDEALRVQVDSSVFKVRTAMHWYVCEHGRYPASMSMTSGALHSWRAILDQTAPSGGGLKMDLSQPWDSPHNIAAATEGNFCNFQRVRDRHGTLPVTAFFVVTGESTAFPACQNSCPEDFRDGLENTVLVIEANCSDTYWTEPVDISWDELEVFYEGSGTLSFGTIHSGGPALLFADLAGYRMKKRLPFEVFQSLFTIDGAEPWTREQLIEQGYLEPMGGESGQPLLRLSRDIETAPK